jgi:FkbM family methyltransferase
MHPRARDGAATRVDRRHASFDACSISELIPAPAGRLVAATPIRGAACALLRRVDFRGKGRLRPLLRVPTSGRRVVRYPSGLLLQLDLTERHQQDLFFGLFERRELRTLQAVMETGGDMVDVGAHIGMFSLTAARAAAAGSRVLALEPNPLAREQLYANILLNGCDNVVVLDMAASDESGHRVLTVPATPDSSWSSLETRTFEPGEPLPVETTTIDAEVEARRLRPSFIKIDVEGHELHVLAGAERTFESQRPLVLCEVSEITALPAAAFFHRIRYVPIRVLPRTFVDGVGPLAGIFNVFFVPAGESPSAVHQGRSSRPRRERPSGDGR